MHAQYAWHHCGTGIRRMPVPVPKSWLHSTENEVVNHREMQERVFSQLHHLMK